MWILKGNVNINSLSKNKFPKSLNETNKILFFCFLFFFYHEQNFVEKSIAKLPPLKEEWTYHFKKKKKKGGGMGKEKKGSLVNTQEQEGLEWRDMPRSDQWCVLRGSGSTPFAPDQFGP